MINNKNGDTSGKRNGKTIEKRNLIIIPTYNEKENIIPLIKKILDTVPGTGIVVVDDDSPDGTAQEVYNFSREIGVEINVIVRNVDWGGHTRRDYSMAFRKDMMC